MTDHLIPLLLLFTAAAALRKHEDPYQRMLQGAGEGLKLVTAILPALVLLLTAVSLLRASGAVDLLSRILAPALRFLGIPPETALLVLIRPLSGSAALAVGTELMARYGVDSPVGRTVAVMLGSTETTFYTVCVYFRAAGVSQTRYTLPAALLADLAGFTIAAWSVRFLY